jgi:prepilin peptidase CpaA
VLALLFPLLVILAGTSDVLSRRVPNKLTLLTALAFVPVAWTEGMPSGTMLAHGSIGIGLLAVGFVLFSLRLVGGGDAKLLAAVGLWLGLEGLWPFLIMTVLSGGLLAVAVLAWSFFCNAERRGAGRSPGSLRLKPSVPYAYAIATGALLAAPQSWWAGPLTS